MCAARLVSLQEAMRCLGVSRSTLYRYVYRGWLQAVRLPGGHLRIPEAELERLERALAGKAAEHEEEPP